MQHIPSSDAKIIIFLISTNKKNEKTVKNVLPITFPFLHTSYGP